MHGFAHHPGRHLHRWGTVRLRMTLWNVAVLALILGALGSVVRYKVQADRFATVDRTLAERAHAERTMAELDPPVILVASPSDSRPEPAARASRPALPRVPAGGRGTLGGGSPAASRSSWPDLAASAIPASPGEPASVGKALPLGPRILSRGRANDSGGEAGHRVTFVGSYAGRKTRTTVRSRLLDPITLGVTAEGSLVGSKPRALPPLQPRVIPRDPAGRPGGKPWEEPWDRHSYVRSLAGRTVYSTVRDHGTPTRVLSMPIERRGKVDRVLQLAYPLDGVLREIDALTSTLLALVPFGLLTAGLGGAFLTGRALRPVREIAGTAARLGASDLSERLPVSGRDEFSELSSSFNAMLARLEEAFDRQRRFTADASHELRTPLSIIKANTSLALEHPWPEDRYREFLAAIDTAAGRQSRIVEELLFLARADAGGLARDVGPVCLIEALEEAAEAVSRPDARPIRLESIDPALMVPGSGSELTRLFTNLLENAVRHTPPEGTVTVSSMVDAKSVTVTVTDTGEGIAPEHLPHLGERFYRVDAARFAGTGGTGLGLAICRSITEAHGGRMTIESKVGEGTAVRIRLLLCPLRT